MFHVFVISTSYSRHVYYTENGGVYIENTENSCHSAASLLAFFYRGLLLDHGFFCRGHMNGANFVDEFISAESMDFYLTRSPSLEPATTPYSCHGVFTDWSIGWIHLEFRSPHRNLSNQLQSQARGLMLTWCRHVHVRPHCFIVSEACSCRLELAYFAVKISKNRLVCKNAVALAYHGSCRLLVMGSWFNCSKRRRKKKNSYPMTIHVRNNRLTNSCYRKILSQLTRLLYFRI